MSVVTVKDEGDIRVIVMNTKLNILNQQMIDALTAAFDGVDESVNGIVCKFPRWFLHCI